MPQIPSESLDWLEKLESAKGLSKEDPQLSPARIRDRLKISLAQASYLNTLRICLDQADIDRVRQAAQATPPFTLSFNNVRPLAKLKGKVADLPGTAHAALVVVLSRRLATAQIKALVKWIISGKPAAEFDPSKAEIPKPGPKPKKRSTAERSKSTVTNPKSQTLPTSGEPAESMTEEENPTQTAAPTLPAQTLGQRVGAAIDALLAGSQATPKPSRHPKAAKKHPELKAAVKGTEKTGKWVARIFWHWTLKHVHHACKELARWMVPGSSRGISAPFRWAVYCLCQLVFWWVLLNWVTTFVGKGLRPWILFPPRYLAGLVAVDLPAWGWRLAEQHMVAAIVIGILLGVGIIGGLLNYPLRTGILLAFLGGIWFYGRGWGTEKLPTAVESTTTAFNRQDAKSAKKDETIGNETTTTMVEPPMHRDDKANSTDPKGSKHSNLHTFTPVTKNIYQPWKVEDEDRGYLEAEIEAIPIPARIKIVTFQADPMSADMSIKRLGDLQDPEKYSLIVGHDKQKVLSVAAAMTGLTLTCGDGLPIGGILGGPGKIEFYWEDVKAIHCDEIKTKAKQLYQLGLVVNGMKKPFLAQCATPEALRHLLSALEFWIGAATHAHPPISGMPYLSQGLRLDQSGKVTTLWDGSPAASARRLQAEGQDLSVPIPKEGIGGGAALQLGDFLWSLDSDSNQPQGKANIEGALDSLTPGKHYLYVVTPEDWKSGPPPSNIRSPRPFNPKREKMELLVP